MVLSLAACGSGGGAGSADEVASLGSAAPEETGGDAAAGAEEQTFREAVLDYAQCMRDQGIEFDDPTFDADGNLRIDPGGGGAGGGPGLGGGQDDPAFPAANEICQDDLEGVAGGFETDPEQQAELRDGLLVFAECMRGQGIDFDDPTFDADGVPQIGGGDGAGPGAQAQDPAFEAAAEQCQGELGDLPGPGGGS